jgi:hypothetical protein
MVSASAIDTHKPVKQTNAMTALLKLGVIFLRFMHLLKLFLETGLKLIEEREGTIFMLLWIDFLLSFITSLHM